MAVAKDPLVSIVGDEIRVKLIRLFFLNQEESFLPKEFTRATKKKIDTIKKTLRILEKDGIIKKKKLTKKEKERKECRESIAYIYNKTYPHKEVLEHIFKDSVETERQKEHIKKLEKIPGVCVIIASNLLNEKKESTIDILTASNKNNEAHIQRAIRNIEQEIGRELQCALLTLNDLVFRIETRDRFIKNIFDGEYEIYLDRVGVLGRRE